MLSECIHGGLIKVQQSPLVQKKKVHLKSKDCFLILIMKFTSRDPETNKERKFENNYEYRIAEFKADNAYNFWDDGIGL